jgi:small conductance mechanosensitive channel
MGVQSFLDSSIAYRVEADTLCMKHFQVERELNKAIKQCFDDNGIEIPFPQVVVHNG